MILPPNTAAIMTNAMSGNARWAVPFQREHTRPCNFHVSAGETIPVAMMNQNGWFRYGDYDSFHVLELPFQGAAVAMVMVLPKAVDGLKAWVETELTAEKYQTWLTELSPTQVRVNLPKFKHGDEMDLKPTLMAMGMTSAFQPGVADFSGMNGNHDLYISAFVQKSFIQIDEDGTQSKVATAVGTRTAEIAPAPAVVFNADHPFFFEIREVKLGVSLFMGQISRPRSDSGWMGAILPSQEGDRVGPLG